MANVLNHPNFIPAEVQPFERGERQQRPVHRQQRVGAHVEAHKRDAALETGEGREVVHVEVDGGDVARGGGCWGGVGQTTTVPRPRWIFVVALHQWM